MKVGLVLEGGAMRGVYTAGVLDTFLDNDIKKEKTGRKPGFLCLLNKLFSALGAGNGDFALAPGDAHHLAAFGAVEVPVLPVLHAAGKLEELPVFLIALVGIPGEAPHQGDDQKGVHAQGQDQVEEHVFHKHGQHAQHQTHDQQSHIQAVVTITTHHEALDSASHIHTGLTQPASSIFHWDHLFAKNVCLLYGFFPRLQRVLRKVHRRFGFRSQKFLRVLKKYTVVL